jgi:hypothetical protein
VTSALRIAIERGDVREAVQRSVSGDALERFHGLVAAVSDPDRHRDVWLRAWSRPPEIVDERWIEPGLWLGYFARLAGLAVPASMSSAVGALAKRSSLVGDRCGEIGAMLPEDAWAAATALGWVAGPVLPGFDPTFVRRFGPLPATSVPQDWEAWRWPGLAVAIAGFGPTLARVQVTTDATRLSIGDRVVSSTRLLATLASARVEVSTGRAANRFSAIVEGPGARRKVSVQRARLVIEDDGEAIHSPEFVVDGRVARYEWT